MAFTPEQIAALYAPFRLEEHSIREGHRSNSGKIQWFVYVERAAVQRRLDEVFPGDWEFHHISTVTHDSFVTVTAGLSIDGKRRDSNGGQSENGDADENCEKGAMTDCFRRCASLWGIGLYLYEMDYPIWTEGYEKGKYQDMEARKKEALDKFRAWYQRMFKSNVVELDAPAKVAGASEEEVKAAMAAKSDLNGHGPKARTIAPPEVWTWNEPEAGKLIANAMTRTGKSKPEVSNTVNKMHDEGVFEGMTKSQVFQEVLNRLATHDNEARAAGEIPSGKAESLANKGQRSAGDEILFKQDIIF